MTEMNLIAGLDIGNGYVKGRAGAFGEQGTTIDLPSNVAVITTSHNIETPDEDVQRVISDIFNEMDASFESHMVRQTNRRLFGRRGVRAGGYVEQFSVTNNHQSKAKQDLSAVLTLGCLAGKALQDYYAKNHALPEENDIIKLRVRVALALPISEYIAYRVEFANAYRTGSHMVTIHNFKHPIRFQVIFDDVQVVAEGAAAQYAIIGGGTALMASLLNDLKSMEHVMPGINKRLAKITPEILLQAKHTCGIDIGEGTVNFPVMDGLSLNADISTSMDKGYGIVLNEALARLKRANRAFTSRKQLTEFLNAGPNPFNEELYAEVQHIVDEEIDGFAAEVEMQFRSVIGTYGVGLELVYVFGGGATSMRDKLYPMLLKALADFGGVGMSGPVLYLDSRYSRNLNRNGLYILADKLAKRASQAAAAQAAPAKQG